MNIDFYKKVKKSTQRMILEAIERSLFTGKTEKIKIQRDLTVEHLLPVEWEEHWPLTIKEESAQAQEKARERRKASIHKIGNLTLVTKKLNPSLSNGPWIKKCPAILKHSALNLNRGFQETGVWNEDAIAQRSACSSKSQKPSGRTRHNNNGIATRQNSRPSDGDLASCEISWITVCEMGCDHIPDTPVSESIVGRRSNI
jgi:hypothetical protein